MGVSNSEMFLSEKDLSSMEFNFLVRPALEFHQDDDPDCEIAPLEEASTDDEVLDHHHYHHHHNIKNQDQEEEEEGNNINDDNDDDGHHHEKHQDQLLQEQEGDKGGGEEEESKSKILLSNLEIKMPILKQIKIGSNQEEEEEEEDGFKTPTSLDHKIPVVLQCPHAPTKPKPIISSSTKRKWQSPRVLLDFSNEIQSLFPPNNNVLLSDLEGGGKFIKKLRKCN